MDTLHETLFDWNIPYAKGKSFQIRLNKRVKKEKKEYILQLMRLRKLSDIPGYEDEWGTNWFHFITLWKNYR